MRQRRRVLLLLLCAGLVAAGSARAESAQRTEHHSAPLGSGGRLEIDNTIGSIQIQGTDMDGVEIDVPPWGAITFVEAEPIIGVTVIGSSCSPPGTVLLHGEPIQWKYPRTGVKMKVQNLWGEHINGWPWREGLTEDWREAGLSSAVFQIPECKKITLMGWSQMEIGQAEVDYGLGHDGHYCVRSVRVTVRLPA